MKLPRWTFEDAYGVSVSRAVGGTNLRFSLGNNEVTGIIPNTKLEKTNLSISFNSTLSKKLKSEGGFNYIITSRENPENSYTMKNLISKVLYAWIQRQLDLQKLQDYYKAPDGTHRTWNRKSADLLVHAPGVVAHEFGVVGADLDGLGQQLDRADRGLELVGNIGDEVAAHGLHPGGRRCGPR